MGPGLVTCGGLIPIALLILALVVMKYLLVKSRKETTIMEKNKKTTKAKNGIHAILETGWAIGTSIAGTQVLMKRATV